MGLIYKWGGRRETSLLGISPLRGWDCLHNGRIHQCRPVLVQGVALACSEELGNHLPWNVYGADIPPPLFIVSKPGS